MIVYYINLIMSLICNLCSRLNKNKVKKIVLAIIAIAIPTIVAGIRYNVGTDFTNYTNWFEYYIDKPLSIQKSNIGFAIFIKLLQLFTHNPQILFFATALIINGLMFIFVKDNTKFYDLGFYLFIALYFYYSSLNIMRQWIAMSIFFYSLKYAYNRKFWKFLIATIIAASFHITALIVIPIYFLMKVKLNKKNMIILIVAIIIMVILLDSVGVYIATQLNVKAKYIKYLKFDTTLDGGGIAYFIFAVITLYIILKNYKNYINNNIYGEYHIKLLIITVLISLLSTNSMIFNRIQLYFTPILIICIPNLVSMIKNKQRMKIIYMIVIILGMLYMTRSLLHNGGEPLPYMTFLNKI